MKKEPNIGKKELKQLIEKNYQVIVKSLEFIHKGADADSYIVTAEDKRKFVLKIHDLDKINRQHLDINFNGLGVLDKMHNQYGISQITYPIRTKTDELYVNFEKYKLSLFNFIKGVNEDDVQLTKEELINFSHVLAEIHKLPYELGLETKKIESFGKEYFQILRDLIDGAIKADKKVATLLGSNNEIILSFVKETQNALNKVEVDEKEYVICHTDPYFLNLIKDNEKVSIIDWDGIRLAPKERDLWFYLIKTICKTPHVFLSEYSKVYGKFRINKELVHFYIRQRVIEDMIHYLSEIAEGDKSPIWIKEIKSYSIEWIKNIDKILSDADKIMDKWNEEAVK